LCLDVAARTGFNFAIKTGDCMVRLLALALALALSAGGARACSKPGNAALVQQQMIDWVNAQRIAHGRQPLTLSGKLQAAAQAHACDMAQRHYFDHQRRGGPDLSQRLRAQGFDYRHAVENIAWTHALDPIRTSQIWRGSPEHWHNALDAKSVQIGLAIAQSGERTYWVMDAGRSH
jgi:uncharacterized protein YkwD